MPAGYFNMMTHSWRYRTWLVSTLIGLVSCSSDDAPKDPDLAPIQDEENTGDGSLDSAKNQQSDQNDASSNANAAENEADNQEAADDEPKKQAISDDGYDDDWNNMGSQQQKQQQQKAEATNTQQQQQEQDEPPLVNASQNQPPEPEPAPEPVANTAVEPPLDPEPAPVVQEAAPPAPEQPAVPTEVAPPSPPPELPNVVSGPPLVKQDIKPVFASLIWVGYDHVERDGVARVEIVTRGSPRFNVFQERNQRDQPELVIRFFQTTLRPKLKRDIDASEFRSPVAFIRMRPDEEENHVDVIITLRDAVQPRMYSKHGDVMLTFALPDHYFGNNTIGDAPVAKAEVLPNTNVMPDVDGGSDVSEGVKVARAFITNPGADAFKNAPADGGQPVQPEPELPTPAPESTPDGLPEDFQTPPSEEELAPPANIPMVNNVPVQQGNNSTNVFPATQATMEGQGLNAQANSQNLDFDDNTGEPEFDGEPTAGNDNFGAEPETGVNGAQQAIPANELDGEMEGEESETLDEDTLDDFDNGEGESSSEIDKFDVRLRSFLPQFAALLITPLSPLIIRPWSYEVAIAQLVVAEDDWQAFGIAGVAQDNFGGDANEPADAGGGDDDFLGGDSDTGGNNFGTGQNAATGNNFGGGNNPAAGANNFGGGNQTNNTNPAGGGANNFGNTNAPVAGNQATSANGNAGNLAAPAGIGDNQVPANAAFGNQAPVNGGGNVAPINNGGATNVVPVNNTGANASNVAAPDGGAAPGEPPVAGEPDLAGEEQTGADSEAAPQPSSGGRPVKLDFRGAPLTEVIRMLGDESGVNFVFPPEIGAKQIYVNLTGVPFNDALKALLEANALGMVQIGPNVVRIDTLARLAADKEAEEKRKRAEVKLRPTKVLVYRLSYAKVENAQKMLADMLGAAAKEDNRISVQLDARTNSIIVNAPANDLAMVKALLERIDLETPQVKIASRIVEVQKKLQQLFGISWAPTFNFDQGRGLGFGNLAFPNSLNSRFAVDAGGTGQSTGSFGLRVGSINNATTLDLALSMEESRSTVEILQSSNLIVEDNAEAEIVAGSSDFFRGAPRALGQGGEEVIEVTYNLNMKVKPHITADGSVQMRVTLESDSPAQPQTQGGQAIAAKNNRSVTTSLLRKSGETAVIGGIYNTQKQKGIAGVPFLMNLPIIGALFRKSNDNEEKRELLVMVTPTILNPAKGQLNSDGLEPSGEGEIAANVQDATNNGGGQGNFGLNAEANQGATNNAGSGEQAEPTNQGGFGAAPINNQQSDEGEVEGNADENVGAQQGNQQTGNQAQPANQQTELDE